MQMRHVVPHILQSTQWIFDLWSVDLVPKLSRHEDEYTACSARGVFGLAAVAALQSSLSQESNARNITIVEPSQIRHVLDAAFPRAHTWMHFMADEESSFANGPCIAALCVLSDLDDCEEFLYPEWFYAVHLNTLALLSTLSPYVQNTVPELRTEFMRKWEELEHQLEAHTRFLPPDIGRQAVVVLLKPLHDALKASQQPVSDDIGTASSSGAHDLPPAPTPPPVEQDCNGQDIEMGYVVRQGGNTGHDNGPETRRGWMLWLRRGSAVHAMGTVPVAMGLLDKLSDWWRARRETRSAQGS
ncbi:hypothetical protein OF83DRAFT_1291304 [Amylostereum chailletii]|nr:hypothetical protein OF83DRAFT_1291304 [Amylostereum chailletii]